MTRPTPQKGVALISALIVVALATTAAASLISSQQYGLRRTENLISRDQAFLYLRAGEQWASTILVTDAKDGKTDHLDEDWAQQLPPLPVEGGGISGSLRDLTGLFNINSIIDSDGKLAPTEYDRMQRLLEAIKLEKTLLDPAVDWIDKNTESFSPSGAEDSFYFNQPKPYRTHNAPLSSISELLLLRGIDEKLYKEIIPFISVLPDAAPINVNTAPLEVLMAIGLSDILAQTIIDERPFDKIEDFTSRQDVTESNAETSNLGVASNYFLLEINARIGRTTLKQFSILQRDGEKIKIVSRSQGTL